MQVCLHVCPRVYSHIGAHVCTHIRIQADHIFCRPVHMPIYMRSQTCLHTLARLPWCFFSFVASDHIGIASAVSSSTTSAKDGRFVRLDVLCSTPGFACADVVVPRPPDPACIARISVYK